MRTSTQAGFGEMFNAARRSNARGRSAPLASTTWNALLAALIAGAALAPGSARAQTIGPSPPTVNAIVVNSGVTTVVGSTDVSTTGTTNAATVNGGTLILDATAGPSPGPIAVQSVNGTALLAQPGGAISVPNGGVSLLTQGGHAALANGAGASVTFSNSASITTIGVGAGLASIGGTVDATGVVVNNTASAGAAISAGHGAIAESGGLINLHAGTTIATAAFNSVGLGASGAGSLVSPDALIPVTMNGRGAMGLYLHDGGQVLLLPSSTLQMNGTSSVGVAVDNTAVALGSLGAGLTINLDGAGVAGQAGSTGLVAFNGATIAVENLTVTGANTAAGAWVRPGSSIVLTGTNTININAVQNPTFYTLVTPTLINPSGSQASIFSVTSAIPIAGLFAQTGTITSANTMINVTSDSGASGPAAGAAVSFNGAIDMAGNTIVTTGAGSHGVRVDSGQVTGRDSTVTTSGGGAALLFNFGPGLIDFTDTEVLATGPGTTGLASLNGTPAAVNTVQLSGGSLTSTDEVAIGAQGPLVVATSGTAVSGGEFLLVAFDQSSFFLQPTFIQLDASDGSVLTGDAIVEAASRADISLATQSHWTGAAFAVTNVSVDPTSVWTITASSNVTQNVSNAGLIEFTAPAGDMTQLSNYKTLTTLNYAGAGGTIGLNTFLGDDSSPSDRLVISGGLANGNSLLAVANTGGPGALTTADGILVVDAINGGTTNPGAFTLGNILAAGPFEYLLFRGGASSVDDWFLRSAINCALPNAPSPPCPSPPPPPVPPPPPPPVPPIPPPPVPPAPPVPPPIPLFRPEAAMDAGLSAGARRLGVHSLGTFHDRHGDQTLLDERRGVWGRAYGMTTERRFSGLLEPEFQGETWGLQAGFDLIGFRSEPAQDRFGVLIGYADLNGDAKGFALARRGLDLGKANIEAFQAGIYWIHVGDEGWYSEGLVVQNWFDADTRSHRGIGLRTDGDGLSASLEAGYPFPLGESKEWLLEPQAQLIYQTIDLKAANDPFARIRFDADDAFTGRLGLRLERPVEAAEQSGVAFWRPYAEFDIWKFFDGEDTTYFNNFPVPLDFSATTLELDTGVAIEITEHLSVNGGLEYTTDLDGPEEQTYGARLGARWNW